MAKKEPIVIAVVGFTGSGKSEATARFVARGFTRFAYSDAIYEEMQRLGYDISIHDEAVQQRVREGLRKEFGMGVAADRIMPRVEAAVEKGENVVIESLYSWSEYKKTKERFGKQFSVLAVYAPPRLRYERLKSRPARPISEDSARSRDYTEIENIEKAGPIAMADWTIKNLGAKDEFLSEVDALIDKILQEN
ncbi:MAG: AAA family ATPase [Candidatus Sungbacteria bacterium]|nr:AAA family ATPase [Candidatus Sungbacteria bacterium]